MGKGDKKSRRGKIILGTFGVRRRRNKAGKPEVSNVKVVKEKVAEDIKPVKEKKVHKEEKAVIPVEIVQEKAEQKEPKAAKKVKKEVVEEKVVKEPKVKKEKKS